MTGVLITSPGLDVSAVMNGGIHQALFPGAHMSSRVGVTTSGFRSRASGGCYPILGQGRVLSASPCGDRGGHPSGRMLLLIAKTKAGIVKADGKGMGWRGSHGQRTQDNRNKS